MTTTFLSTVKPPSRAGSLLQATAVVRVIREQSHQAGWRTVTGTANSFS